jgi:hypothetical protein
MVAYNLHNNKNSSRVLVAFDGIPSIESMGRKENIFLSNGTSGQPPGLRGGFFI